MTVQFGHRPTIFDGSSQNRLGRQTRNAKPSGARGEDPQPQRPSIAPLLTRSDRGLGETQ